MARNIVSALLCQKMGSELCQELESIITYVTDRGWDTTIVYALMPQTQKGIGMGTKSSNSQEGIALTIDWLLWKTRLAGIMSPLVRIRSLFRLYGNAKAFSPDSLSRILRKVSGRRLE